MRNDIELINPNIPRGKVRCAVFDFDGTLSLLREGWPQVMRAVMLDALMATPARESAEELERFVTDLIYQTSGQQTIYQMIRLADEVVKRGGAPDAPQMYKQIFADRVLARVNERVAAIRGEKYAGGMARVGDGVAVRIAPGARRYLLHRLRHR